MPKYKPPRSNLGRSSFLAQALDTGTKDRTAGNNFISQESLDNITNLLPSLEIAVSQVGSRLSVRAKEIRERASAVGKTKRYLRDLWVVLKRRVERLEQPAEVLTYYQLPLDGLTPNPTAQDEWLMLAEQVVKGDDRAVLAGYPPMTNPSAAELAEVLAAAKKESHDVAMADREYDQAQETMAALRPQAAELIAEVMAELRFNLRKKDAPSQRRIMRSYGAHFSYLKGEPPDPDNGEDE